MAGGERDRRLAEIGNRYTGYTVYDEHYEKVGKVDDLFVGEYDEPEYVGVKIGLLGTRSILIPMDAVRVNDRRKMIQVSAPKDAIKDGPTFSDDRDITPEFERRVHNYYGTAPAEREAGERGAYGAYYSGDEDVDLRPGERERPQTTPERPVREPRSAAEDRENRDEVRIERKEEELVAGTREKETGHVNVRKRVRTEKQRLRVPKRREEVRIDRVAPSEASRARAEIREAEIRLPVSEEEVVVEKRPEVKEEIHIRKEIVADEEVVEETLRKEEVEVDEETRP